VVDVERVRGFLAPPAASPEVARRFGEIALAQGFLTAAELQEGLGCQIQLRKAGEHARLGEILLNLGFLTEDQVLDVLEIQTGLTRSCPICGKVGPGGHCQGCGAPVRRPKRPGPPSTVGRFRIVREIARGGVGIVCEVEDTRGGRLVALKLLKLDRENPTSIRRLEREAAIMSRLRHPGIVAVHEVGETPDIDGSPLHYIAMELVQGRNFAELLHEGKLSLCERIEILLQAVQAVAHAHAHGVVHRDLKPSNILVNREGRALLTDFGLARAELFRSKLTQTLEVLGTPAYMSPEQTQGNMSAVREASDIYSLGVILYEILTGQVPFRAKIPSELLREILEREPERPSRVHPSVSRRLESICLRAMEKEPRDRHSDAKSFGEDLERWLLA